MLRSFPDIKNRLKKEVHSYSDHWKDYKLEAIKSITYFNKLSINVMEEFHYKFQISSFEEGAKLFSRGVECDVLYIIISGELELFIDH
jgi:hypothetical protein